MADKLTGVTVTTIKGAPLRFRDADGFYLADSGALVVTKRDVNLCAIAAGQWVVAGNHAIGQEGAVGDDSPPPPAPFNIW